VSNRPDPELVLIADLLADLLTQPILASTRCFEANTIAVEVLTPD
jgi:hypothetical protein